MKTPPTVELWIQERGSNLKPISCHSRLTYGHAAQFTMDLLKLTSGEKVPDGENSDGSQKFRLQTPDEAVARVVALSEGLLEVLESKGWTAPVPPLSELLDEGGAVGFGAGK